MCVTDALSKMADTAVIYWWCDAMRCDAKVRVSETFGGKKTKQNKTRKRTTKGGPHGHVHRARNFISESGRPCDFHAFLNLHDAIPMESQAI